MHGASHSRKVEKMKKIKTVSSLSHKKFIKIYSKDLHQLRNKLQVLYIFSGLVVVLLLAIVFYIFDVNGRVTKMLSVTSVPIMQEVLSNDLHLGANQSSFPPKIIEKEEEDKLIQNKSHKDQSSMIEIQRKPYLEVPPKVKIPLPNEGNYLSKVIDQPTYTDHKLKTNIIESIEAPKVILI